MGVSLFTAEIITKPRRATGIARFYTAPWCRRKIRCRSCRCIVYCTVYNIAVVYVESREMRCVNNIVLRSNWGSEWQRYRLVKKRLEEQRHSRGVGGRSLPLDSTTLNKNSITVLRDCPLFAPLSLVSIRRRAPHIFLFCRDCLSSSAFRVLAPALFLDRYVTWKTYHKRPKGLFVWNCSPQPLWLQYIFIIFFTHRGLRS